MLHKKLDQQEIAPLLEKEEVGESSDDDNVDFILI